MSGGPLSRHDDMTTDLVPVVHHGAVTAPSDMAARLYAAWIESQTPRTREAYAQDIAAFATFLGEATATAAMNRLLSLSGGEGNALLLDYRTRMVGEGSAPATINRRLSAIRSAVKLARTLGYTTWTPEISGVKAQTYRDTKGPGIDGTRSLIEMARTNDHSAIALRDVAIIRLMFDLGLRRGECVGLDLDDIDRGARRVWILGKGRSQKEVRSLPDKTLAALDAWIAARALYAKPGETAVFIGLSGRGGGKRITGRSVHRIIAEIGRDAGIKTRPHGLRHASITAALDMNNGDVRAAQQHARHANPQTTMRYDDNRRDLAGQIADSLAALV